MKRHDLWKDDTRLTKVVWDLTESCERIINHIIFPGPFAGARKLIRISRVYNRKVMQLFKLGFVLKDLTRDSNFCQYEPERRVGFFGNVKKGDAVEIPRRYLFLIKEA